MSDDQQHEREQTGIPRRMKATCSNCGNVVTGGTVTVWLKREETPDDPEFDGRITNEPRDDVSYKCRECESVCHQEVEIVAYH